MYSYEPQKDLQVNFDTSLVSCIQKFEAKGGVLSHLFEEKKPFVFLPGDFVFPACSGGNNRSQTLWNILRNFPQITVQKPHATQYGFDPYNHKATWTNINPQPKEDEFLQWAGVSKSAKLGWDKFESWISKPKGTQDEIAKLRDYYNKNYYSPLLPEGSRRVYIAFAKNAHIHLKRLIESNASLKYVYVLYFPLQDWLKNPPAEWNTHSRSVKTYQEFSNLLLPHLDFSQL